jgi:hypothetical protein
MFRKRSHPRIGALLLGLSAWVSGCSDVPLAPEAIAPGKVARSSASPEGVGALSSTISILNPSGGTSTSDGLKIWTANGAFQVQRNGERQVYYDGRDPAGPEASLSVGLYTEGGTFYSWQRPRVNWWTQFRGAITEWTQVSNTLINSGTTWSNTEELTGGSYQVKVTTVYRSPNPYADVTIDVTLPSGVTAAPQLYFASDFYLDGCDRGPGATGTMDDGTRFVVQAANNCNVFEEFPTLNAVGGLIEWPAVADAFTSWQESVYTDIFGNSGYGPKNGTAYKNRVDRGLSTDAGVGAHWDLGTTAAGTVRRRVRIFFGTTLPGRAQTIETTTRITSVTPKPVAEGEKYKVTGTVTPDSLGPRFFVGGTVTVTGDGEGCATENFILLESSTPGVYNFECEVTAGSPGTKTLTAEYTAGTIVATFDDSDDTETQTVSSGEETITVTADDMAVPFSSAEPTYTVTYTDSKGNAWTPPAEGWTAPTCTSSYTTSTSPTNLDITCTGAVADGFTFTYENGTLTIGKVVPVLTWTGTTGSVTAGSTITLSATVSPSACGPVLYGVFIGGDFGGIPEPSNGTFVTPDTAGVFGLVAGVEENTNCLSNATFQTVTTSESALPVIATTGGGTYAVSGTSVNFGHTVQKTGSRNRSAGTETTTYTGQLQWSVSNAWRFNGTVSTTTTVAEVSGAIVAGTAPGFVGVPCPAGVGVEGSNAKCARFTGTGTLEQYNRNRRRWEAVGGLRTFTATVYDGGTTNTCNRRSCSITDVVDWFGLALDGTVPPGVPVSEPQRVTKSQNGGIVVRD